MHAAAHTRAVLPRQASLRRRGGATARAVRASAVSPSREAALRELAGAIADVQSLPPSQRREGSESAAKQAKQLLSGLKEAGDFSLYDSYTGRTQRRNIALFELRQVGVQDPDKIGLPSVRNDAAFLGTVVFGSSALALVLGQLPGDWGFFGMYLSGGLSIAVLGVGSVAPGLLQVPISLFSNVFPDYRDRVLRHEAAHFLVGYLLGVPVVNYSLDIGAEHTDFLEARLERKLISPQRLDDAELDALAVVAMAGVAAEALQFPEVVGQNADLYLLQKTFSRAATPLASGAQQNLTRWAVWQAAAMLKANAAAFEALQLAMARRAPVVECIQAIEAAAAPK